jgi:predicted phage terminase large subunit-like protein
MGIPVMDFTPGRGKDKHSRVNAVAPIFESGQVYYPRDEKFAEEVIEECAAFPHGEHDDYVDSTTQAMLRYRQGYFVSTYSDEDEVTKYKNRKYVYY